MAEEDGAPMLPVAKCDDAWMAYVQENPEEIVDEVAVKYGIEAMYQDMAHFHSLSSNYLSGGVPIVLSKLLSNINVYYTHATTSSAVSASDLLAASSFGKDKFVKVLDQLHTLICIDLSKYRNIYPASNPERLKELKATVDLLNSITFFRIKVQELDNQPAASRVVRDCVQASLRSTYHYMFKNCYLLYQRDYMGMPVDEEKLKISRHGPNLGNVKFWTKLVTLMSCMIEEDNDTYASALNQFPDELNIGQVSAATLWSLFAVDIKYAMEEHDKHGLGHLSVYIELNLKVQWLYRRHVKDIPPYSESVPEYPSWFEPFVMKWLTHNDQMCLKYLETVFSKDRELMFPKLRKSVFSESFVDVGILMMNCFGIVYKLECPDPEINNRYVKTITQTLTDVARAYTESVKKAFFELLTEERVACVLMNNIHHLRLQHEKIFAIMGVFKLEQDTADIVDNVQKSLISTLDEQASVFALSLEPQLTKRVIELGELLQKVEDAGVPGQPQPPATDEDKELLLVDFLDAPLATTLENCDKFVLKLLLKGLWKILMKVLDENVVIPPTTDKMMMLKSMINIAKTVAPKAKIEDEAQQPQSTVGKEYVRHVLTGSCCTCRPRKK